MRGKGLCNPQGVSVTRITPAYAGKRCRNPIIAQARGDHPRVCGEKNWSVGVSDYLKGSPPRMRGKVTKYVCKPQGVGITPAYAGKSVHGHRAAGL